MISKSRDIRLLLSDIRSVYNTGSIFRTAETLGISKIYCCGTTPVPVDRFQRKRKDFAKVSLGSEEIIPWEHSKDSETLLKKLKKEGFQIIALEQAENSVDYKKVKLKNKSVIMVGNEVTGINNSLLKLSDVVAEIPLAGKKESLNVAVATGIFLYRLLDK